MSHTPGPWSIEVHGNGYALYSGRSDMMHGLNLVNMVEPDWNWNANASLISAAPELLTALQSYVSHAEGWERLQPLSSEAQRRLDTARAAIAKATGEQP